ncbi:nucleotidyltransferase family protein [Butyrivibrio fibrisolvens]|uniref:nucleotidyltransferase family protein n=1 Tax=Butyrivibrio fibrisolvens TaxID=831 RepID=UPI00042A8F63|nr:nucleotidyltransferase family protein [Butyrivibrio fibrisolvens]
MGDLVPREDVLALFDILNSGGIKYMLIKNIDNELPDKLKKRKDIDILVHPNDVVKIRTLLENEGFERVIHSQSVESGWKLLYGAHDCSMYRSKNLMEVDIHDSLCVKSTMVNGWVPLDKRINDVIWDTREWDEELNCWKLNLKIMFVYLIARSIFDKGTFSDPYINEINRHGNLLDDEQVKSYMEVIFFGFSEKLKKLIKTKQYGIIVDEYYRFSDY